MKARLSPGLMALRVAAELCRGQVVNLGPGFPALVSGHLPPDRGIILHAGNCLVGYLPREQGAKEEVELVDAYGGPVTMLAGGAVVNQTESFGIVRGGHLDVAVVETDQVSERGDLVLSKDLKEQGVEIAAGAKIVIAMMEHTNPEGRPKVLKECSRPAELRGRVGLIVTDTAVVEITREGLILKEVAPGWTTDDVQAITGVNMALASGIREMDFAEAHDAPLSKVYSTGAEAVADISDGAVILLDGFAGPGGMAQYLIVALRDHGAKALTMISNTAGIARVAAFGTPPGFTTIDHSLLVDNGQIKKAVASFPVSPSPPSQPLSSSPSRGAMRSWSWSWCPRALWRSASERGDTASALSTPQPGRARRLARASRLASSTDGSRCWSTV